MSLISTVQLTRLANAFAGVANLWFVVLWTRATNLEHNHNEMLDQWPLWVLLTLTAILGVGLSTYAGVLNDLFDVKRDQTFSPNRPIAAGRISGQGATIIGFASLLAAMAAATVLSRDGLPVLFACLVCAGMILMYNAVSRHVPSLGLLTIAAIFALQMMMINIGLRFIWPVMLLMVHATAVHAAVYRLQQKRPRHTWLTIVGVLLGLAGLIVLLIWQTKHEGPLFGPAYSWWGLSWPAATVILFILSTVNKTRFASSPAFAAEKLQRYGSLWMAIYGVAWLVGASLYAEAGVLAGLVVLAVVWMVVIRDIGAWIEQPVGYRW